MVDGTGLATYVERFGNLGVAREGPRPRPHKPAMLLAVLSLSENGRLTENRIVPDPELVELFKVYFHATRAGNDRCTPENPFLFLRSDGFWRLHAYPGHQAQVDTMASPGSWAAIVRLVAHASLDEALFTLMATPVAREALRDTLSDTYFPTRKAATLAISVQEQKVGIIRNEWANGAVTADEGKTDARDAAFARTVKQAYDYQCAACGLRFIYEDTTMIDAAHLMPWSTSHDDRPQNGMALCKNHHWVMDQHFCAPGPDLRWHVSDRLDRRLEGHSMLLALKGQDILLPKQKKLMPDPVALEWQLEQLR